MMQSKNPGRPNGPKQPIAAFHYVIEMLRCSLLSLPFAANAKSMFLQRQVSWM